MIDAPTLASVKHQLAAARLRVCEGSIDHGIMDLIDAIDALVRDVVPLEPARNWRPDAILWRCRGCKRVLGKVAPGRLLVTHMRREIEVEGVRFRQICDDCRTENHWPQEGVL